jgi:asparagine synthase (glutamine-hydrolysing)
LSAIAGAILADGNDMSDAILARIVAASPPRGFDGVSRWRDGPAGMIRFHHATTPEALSERQPLAGASGAVIAFDGRLDNRADLLALLDGRGSDLKEAPDVDIALALWERLGERFLNDLVGDWALAIWQPDARRLFCARSPMGWRPFLWTFDGKTFGFATEPRALVVGLGLERRLNEGAIGEMLSARFVTPTDTFWDGIQRLGQGGALVFEKGRCRTWHWHTGPFEDLSYLSEGDLIDRFRQLLDQSLIACMRSNTAVTAHLSGGLDSSTVVARATELHRAGRIDRQVGAVSARFPGEEQDETQWSNAVEDHLGLTAQVTTADPYVLEDARRWTADTFQLPLRPNVNDTSTAAYRMMLSAGSRVLLTGEGGDDWIAGTLSHLPDMLRKGDLPGLFREAMTQFPQLSPFFRLRRAGYLASAPIFSRAYRTRFLRPHLTYDGSVPGWIRSDWAERIGLAARWETELPSVDFRNFAQMQRYNVFAHARRHLAHDTILACAEQHGVEIRHPLHDLRLANFFMGVPGRVLLRNGERKYLLREAMRGTLPESVRQRQDKAIFITSLIDAIADRFRECPPAKLLPVKLGWVDGDKLEEMFAPALDWRGSGSVGPLSRGRIGPVWFVIAIDMWLERAFGMS